MQTDRVARLRMQMEKMSVDAFLVTDPVNIAYLSGFTGDAGVVLVTENEQFLITDSRFKEAVSRFKTWQCVITREYLRSVCEIAAKDQLLALAFEDSLSYRDYDFLDETALCDIVPLNGVLEKMRSVKEPEEIALLRKSCKLAEDGYRMLLQEISAGQAEIEVANHLDQIMKKLGATASSFPTIVASGTRTILPHGSASTKVLQQGELVTLDFGYFYKGYTSDVTRTFSLGRQPESIKALYQVVAHAQQQTIAAVRPGITGAELDQIGRSLITQAGYGAYFNHGMGHGIGQSIHELPNIGKNFANQLEPGQVITIEPGIYLPPEAGIRIEDDILVTADGFEELTNFAKEYIEVMR
ncbi:M24 family metallopeptidase [Liquorilactobacillus satsumensis]|uniref:M24 family metallopeptidase n=1 Tax=Liquorilactobacillus satsumensis TaxID=259059 RepID=UPI0021C35B4F|nr:Xaa-Pro peptidase family protein [Liquorilactobacillus satsumensis]MCP9327737.1 aminopeptidase P family protein [Liquorilactobacillus satsumensis]